MPRKKEQTTDLRVSYEQNRWPATVRAGNTINPRLYDHRQLLKVPGRVVRQGGKAGREKNMRPAAEHGARIVYLEHKASEHRHSCSLLASCGRKSSRAVPGDLGSEIFQLTASSGSVVRRVYAATANGAKLSKIFSISFRLKRI